MSLASLKDGLDENEYIEKLLDSLDSIEGLDEASKALIRRALSVPKPPKMTPQDIMKVWEVERSEIAKLPGVHATIFWIEEGNTNAGYKHILAHKEDFDNVGIPENRLLELAEATTTVGKASGKFQGKQRAKLPPRPILLLYFYEHPVAVAISVGNNGFVVGMNPANFDRTIEGTDIDQNWLMEVSRWPRA